MPQLRTILPAILVWTLCCTALGQMAGPADPAPGQLVEVEPTGVVAPEEISRASAPLFGIFGPVHANNPVASYRVRYATTDLDGSMTTTTAQLFVPLLEEPRPVPLLVFGSGTTGIGPHCAPSREVEYRHPIGHYRENLLAYAGRGFVAIIPDYLGFSEEGRVQEYFNAVAEGRVMLDAIRAVQHFFATHPQEAVLSAAVFAGGYSQGGHAAFAAADLRPEYAPEVPLMGLIGFGATTNVTRLLREGPYYAPYIVASYSQSYGRDDFDPSAVLASRWLPTLEQDTSSLCVDRAQQHYPFDGSQIYAPDFAAALHAGTLERDFPEIHRILEENRTGLSGHGLPALIVQGEDDIIVRNPSQTRFVEELCEAGSPVLYLRYPGVRHKATRQAGFEESIAWMLGIATGKAEPSTCPTI